PRYVPAASADRTRSRAYPIRTARQRVSLDRVTLLPQVLGVLIQHRYQSRMVGARLRLPDLDGAPIENVRFVVPAGVPVDASESHDRITGARTARAGHALESGE